MEFENAGLGKCIMIKDASKELKLVYAIENKQYIIVRDFNKETGNWGGGSYFGNDIDGALETYNKRVKEVLKLER